MTRAADMAVPGGGGREMRSSGSWLRAQSIHIAAASVGYRSAGTMVFFSSRTKLEPRPSSHLLVAAATALLLVVAVIRDGVLHAPSNPPASRAIGPRPIAALLLACNHKTGESAQLERQLNPIEPPPWVSRQCAPAPGFPPFSVLPAAGTAQALCFSRKVRQQTGAAVHDHVSRRPACLVQHPLLMASSAAWLRLGFGWAPSPLVQSETALLSLIHLHAAAAPLPLLRSRATPRQRTSPPASPGSEGAPRAPPGEA